MPWWGRSGGIDVRFGKQSIQRRGFTEQTPELSAMEDYQIERECTHCGFEAKALLTKREAAFRLFDTHELFGSACPRCGGKDFSGSASLPMLDKELISEWTQNENLNFSQDEELILGNGEYFNLIIEALNNPQTLLHKKYVLLDALCIIVFDETVDRDDGWKPDINLKQLAIKELNARKDLLIQAGDWIMGYVQKVVYPQLDIN